MILLGVNAQNHDASVTLFDTDRNEIVFAGHAERYSREKNDKHLNFDLMKDALSYVNGQVDEVIWYENPFQKKMRYLRSGQWSKIFSEKSPESYLQQFGINKSVVLRSDHHLSHAAGSYFTSPFDKAAVVVIDAIGESSTTTIYDAQGSKLTPVLSKKYPHSIGLFYSAITQLCGLKPNEEEYILMGMAAYGDASKYKQRIIDDLFKNKYAPQFEVKYNMHRGILWWMDAEDLTDQDRYDLAAAAQSIVEEYLIEIATWAKVHLKHTNIVLSGGVALNCVANTVLAQTNLFDNIWILPNPGDAGNSLGAILNHTRVHTDFKSPFLGYDIDRPFDMEGCLNALLNGQIVGVANGRAEFGPRALGNRSLIADPRGPHIKDAMNEIKKRQKFRPFAPMVIHDVAHEYFNMSASSPFMQFVARVKDPQSFPAICHHDNSARVQTIQPDFNPRMYELLNRFYQKTGCPILVNTSLNIKGEPLVNTWDDAQRFSKKYNVDIF